MTARDTDRGKSGRGETDRFKGRDLLLVVTGGIAAYKSCFLVRELVREGAAVQVLLTSAASRFVTPLTFSTLSGKPALDDLFPTPPPPEPIHLKPVHGRELLVVAPATADFIGKLACGIADDLASTAALAFEKTVLLAPAMNPAMWRNQAVQRNIAILRDRGVRFVGPAEGEMAGVGEHPGQGRMAEPEEILDRIEELLADCERWRGRKVIVTSGPTRESIDPVRFISNRSSGRMGDAIARQAVLRGADVLLVRGRGAVGRPAGGAEVIEVETAAEMSEVVKDRFGECDVLVMAAAVADWTPETQAPKKLKKKDGLPRISWKKTDDILKWAGSNKKHQLVVGFALETERHLDGARMKLVSKKADLIVLNDPTRPDSAFGGDTIRMTLVPADGEEYELPPMRKAKAAERLLDEVDRLKPTL